MTASWNAGVFDRLYAESPDPWNFAGSPYERAKYSATLDALGDRMFDHVLEVGCSIGVLTRRLAPRARAILALDVAQAALDQASERCRDLAHVTFRRAMVPAEFPDGLYDLILLSEVLYFLDAPDVTRTATLAQAHLAPGGLVVLVNWTGKTNTPTTGDAAVRLFSEGAGRLRLLRAWREATYRLDVFSSE